MAALYNSGILGFGCKIVEAVEFSIVKVVVAVFGVLVAFLFFPVYAIAGATLTIASLLKRPNRFAAPGAPVIEYPRFSPLLGSAQSQWYLGIVWILQWDSIVEVLMILQILPLLMVPLQVIFSNFLEEIMSWIFGKYNLQAHRNEKSMPSLPSVDFPFFLLFDLPARIGRSIVLLGKWIGFMVVGNASLYNENHALVNYIQGIDFGLDKPILRAFPTKRSMSKTNAVVLAKSAMLSYERFRIVRDVVNHTWHGAKYWDAWEFDYVCLTKDGKRLRKVDSDISATLVQSGRALVLAFRGTEPLKNSNWAVDLNTEPPPPGEVWPYGVYHMGFRVALGLGPNLAGDPTCEMRYLQLGERGDYQRLPGPGLHDLVRDSPFELIKARIEQLLRDKPELKLYVTGHSLGAALANIFSAALVIPPRGSGHFSGSEWEERFGALYDFGQPRLGNYTYSALLDNILSRNRMDRKFLRIVNTDDIVCRVPPPQVTPPPWYTDAPFWQHNGYTVFLPAVHAVYDPDAQDNAPPRINGGFKLPALDTDLFRTATHKQVPQRSDRDARNPFARNRNPSVVHLTEQPPIYRGSSFWHAVKKAIWATEDYFHGGAGVPGSTLTWNPPPSGLRVLTLWLLIITVLPLGLALLPTPLFPLGIILIVISLLEGGLPQGVSDHAMDGYLKALIASSEGDWNLQHRGTQ